MKILVPDTIEFVIDGLAPADEVVVYDVTARIPPEHRAADVLVVWQNPEERLKEAAQDLSSVSLVQALASGTDRVVVAGFRPDAAICSGRSLHDGPVAEHTLALTLAAVRRLDRLHSAQLDHHWDTELGRAQAAAESRSLFTLTGAKVLIWGFGSIAARLAPALSLLGAEVTGVARTAGVRAGFVVVDDEEALELLAGTDVLISLLPWSPASAGFFDRAVFGALRRGAVFVNVGRGATVDEGDLVAALQSGQLRSAALDVTRTEPLPPTSPLWEAPNVIITPHVAGNRPVGAGGLVSRNIESLRVRSELENRVR